VIALGGFDDDDKGLAFSIINPSALRLPLQTIEV